MRQFRQIKIPIGKVKVRSTDGRIVPVRLRQLTEAQKRRMSQALSRIETSLERCDDIEGVDDAFRDALKVGARRAGFVTTGSSNVISFLIQDPPVMILNRSLFNDNSDHFCATVLGELLHLVRESSTAVVRSSIEGAKQDMMCYALLNLDVPVDHWAFKKYPELLEAMIEAEGESEDENGE